MVTFVKRNKPLKSFMIRKIKELYKTFEPYVKVDLIMYGVMIVLIILYLAISY